LQPVKQGFEFLHNSGVAWILIIGELHPILNISCIVLAGGKSTRLGRNKLAEIVGDKMLFHRVLDVLSLLGGEVIIVTSHSSSLPDISNYPHTRIVNDIYPRQGLLSGIYTGLSESESTYNFVAAADMPFLNLNLVQYMLRIAEGADLVAYREDCRFEPLHAVYSQECMGTIKALISRKNARILEIVDSVKTRYLAEEEITKFDPLRLSFFNINTEDELQKALRIVKDSS